MLRFLRSKNCSAFLLFTAVFWGCMLYVFWPVLPSGKALPASDSTNLYGEAWISEFIAQILDGNMAFVNLMFPVRILAYYWTLEFYYMVLGFFAALSMFYYLRTQNLSRLAAYGGGGLFGFIGYWFTLFSAGHGTTTLTWGYIVLPFALINRCFQTRRVIYFALLGLSLVWAMPQIDVWMVSMFLFAAYGVWCSVQEWKQTKSLAFIGKVYPRFLVTIAVIGCVGFLSFQGALSGAKSGRESQFSAAAGDDKHTEESSDAQVKREFAQWIFCTNWSLPPEDVAELLVPGLFGDASYAPPYPYWGRLGREYQFAIGKMRPNLRQHTVYVGVITILLAIFGMMGWRVSRKRSLQSDLAPACPSYRDVPFWTVAVVVCVVFAMGRYTPLYNIPYYGLPFGNYLRAPVKWFHLAEIGIAMLAGFGIEGLLRAEMTAVQKKGWIVASVLVGLLVMLWLGFYASSPSLTRYISQLGFGQLAPTLMKYTLSNIARTILIVFVTGGLLFWLSKMAGGARKVQAIIVGVIILIGMTDLAIVARRYVQVVDVGPHHALNPIVQALKSRTGGLPANIMNYVTSGHEQQDWLSASLRLHGYANMAPGGYDPIQSELFRKYQSEPIKYWEIRGVRFVLLPRKDITPFIQQGLVTPLGDFQVQSSGSIRSIPPQSGSIVLAEVNAYAPLPALYGQWHGSVPVDRQQMALQAYTPGLPVSSLAPPPANHTNAIPQPVQMSALRGQKGVLVTRGRIESVKHPSLLVLNEVYKPNLVAAVNGKNVTVGTTNGQWASIEIPAGTSAVTLRQRWDKLPLICLSIVTNIALLLWLFVDIGIRKRQNCGQASVSRQ